MPRGVAVVIEATHQCMTTRGVHKPGVAMVTSRMLGAFRDDASTRREFLAMIGNGYEFDSGRQLGAWLGLVPRQSGTGGRVKLLGISKRGDTYLRTLLIHGARSVLTHAKEPGPWLEGLKGRRPANVVVVAQAAKMARTIWAVTAKEQSYQRGYQSVRPSATVQAV